ncbi:hypothetical protein N9M43_00460 [Candidatus Pelagibacter bacterium]|nr:hypothetical protein [Candidatus Pelagibacter bacterium]
MVNDQVELSFLSIFTLITFFIFLIICKYSYKIKKGILLDQDFQKPQAFHMSATGRSGGLAGIISLNIFFIIYYLIFSKILFEYLFLCNLMFLIGFLDDLKIKISPSKRLVLMIIFLSTLIYFIPIKILNIDIPYINIFLNNEIFIFFCFTMFFIYN